MFSSDNESSTNLNTENLEEKEVLFSEGKIISAHDEVQTKHNSCF